MASKHDEDILYSLVYLVLTSGKSSFSKHEIRVVLTEKLNGGEIHRNSLDFAIRELLKNPNTNNIFRLQKEGKGYSIRANEDSLFYKYIASLAAAANLAGASITSKDRPIEEGIALGTSDNNSKRIKIEVFVRLAQAVIAQKQVSFQYNQDYATVTRVDYRPALGLYFFNDIWYLICPGTKQIGSPVAFGLDRITELKVREGPTVVLDWQSVYNRRLGVSSPFPDCLDTTVILAVDARRFQRLLSVPLHHSQVVQGPWGEREGWQLLRYEVEVNQELLMKLLSFEASVVVVSPSCLQEKVVACLRGALAAY